MRSMFMRLQDRLDELTGDLRYWWLGAVKLKSGREV